MSCMFYICGRMERRRGRGNMLMCGNRLLFAATTVMAAMHCWNTRGTHNSKHDPAVEVHPEI